MQIVKTHRSIKHKPNHVVQTMIAVTKAGHHGSRRKADNKNKCRKPIGNDE